MHVIRWGQSAYETDDDLAHERAGAKALGLGWSAWPDVRTVPDGLSRCDALVVTSKVSVSRDVVEALPDGALVLTTTSGYEHLDLEAVRDRGLSAGRCPLARRDAVVEQAIGSLVGLMRQLPAQLDAAAAGRWSRSELPELAPRGLNRSTIAVVGLGVIGSRCAKLLQDFGADVLGVDPIAAPEAIARVSLDQALSAADAVTLHCSLTPSSRGLLGEAELSVLPAHAVVVNTARGGSVDVPAAVAAVRAGQLRGLALDVFPEEPWPSLSDGAHPRIWFTPHAAGFTHDLGRRVADEVVAALTAWTGGDPVPHALP